MTDAPDATTAGTNDAAAASAPPGWYPDASGQQRWWDGRAWTDYTAAPAVGNVERPKLAEGVQLDTAWVWVVSLVPFIASIPTFFMDFRGYIVETATGQIGSATMGFWAIYAVQMVLSLGSYALVIVASYKDYKHLVSVGVVRPFHWAFSFLAQLVYLIGRHVVLRKVTRPSGAPLWVHLALYVLLFIAVGIWMSSIFSATFELVGMLGNR